MKNVLKVAAAAVAVRIEQKINSLRRELASLGLDLEIRAAKRRTSRRVDSRGRAVTVARLDALRKARQVLAQNRAAKAGRVLAFKKS